VSKKRPGRGSVSTGHLIERKSSGSQLNLGRSQEARSCSTNPAGSVWAARRWLGRPASAPARRAGPGSDPGQGALARLPGTVQRDDPGVLSASRRSLSAVRGTSSGLGSTTAVSPVRQRWWSFGRRARGRLAVTWWTIWPQDVWTAGRKMYGHLAAQPRWPLGWVKAWSTDRMAAMRPCTGHVILRPQVRDHVTVGAGDHRVGLDAELGPLGCQPGHRGISRPGHPDSTAPCRDRQ